MEIHRVVEILAIENNGTSGVVEILANENIGIYLIVVYKLFVSRGRRKREFIFRTCILKNECISIIFCVEILANQIRGSDLS